MARWKSSWAPAQSYSTLLSPRRVQHRLRPGPAEAARPAGPRLLPRKTFCRREHSITGCRNVVGAGQGSVCEREFWIARNGILELVDIARQLTCVRQTTPKHDEHACWQVTSYSRSQAPGLSRRPCNGGFWWFLRQPARFYIASDPEAHRSGLFGILSVLRCGGPAPNRQAPVRTNKTRTELRANTAICNPNAAVNPTTPVRPPSRANRRLTTLHTASLSKLEALLEFAPVQGFPRRAMNALLHSLSFPGAMLERGFWQAYDRKLKDMWFGEEYSTKVRAYAVAAQFSGQLVETLTTEHPLPA